MVPISLVSAREANTGGHSFSTLRRKECITEPETLMTSVEFAVTM